MPTHKGLYCAVHTKDGALHEYYSEDSERERDSLKTVYIEAEDAAPFWFKFKSLPGYEYSESFGDRVAFSTYIDGEFVGIYIVSQNHPHEILSLSDTDTDTDTDTTDLLDKIGEISVYALRAKHLGYEKWSGIKRQNPSISISEKKVKGKGLTHTTQLRASEKGSDVPQGDQRVCELQLFETLAEPYVHFRFLYRSRRSLQNLGLIPCTPVPRTPSPPPLSVEVAEEIARLRARLKSLERLGGVSRKIEGDENPGLRAKRRKVEIIDD